MERETLRTAPVESEQWERAAEAVLADSEYDTELGTEMGRDAIRVARGELSEATFFERYHEAVLEEFGVDNRQVRRDEEQP
jgi:hypothetical protein